ncbi:MAG: hypothetical protein AB8G05_17280 [Oligoflexales bacterium]
MFNLLSIFIFSIMFSCSSNKIAKIGSSDSSKLTKTEKSLSEAERRADNAEARVKDTEAKKNEEAEIFKKEREELKNQIDILKNEKNQTNSEINQTNSDLSNSDAANQNKCLSIADGNWLLVPGNSNFRTSDFCVMKYEAKCSKKNGTECNDSQNDEVPVSIPSNTPWTPITQQDAEAKCALMGEGFHLITNNEWMTIGTNVLKVSSNWNSTPSSVGIGQLIRGHSDGDPAKACEASSDDTLNIVKNDCMPKASSDLDFVEQRTLQLSNGEFIWDLSGNVWEWTSLFIGENKPTLIGDNWEFTEVVGSLSLPLSELIPQIAISNEWNSKESIGKYVPGFPGSDLSIGGALLRGGGWGDNSFAGIFSARLDNSQTSISDGLGFRCAYTIP